MISSELGAIAPKHSFVARAVRKAAGLALLWLLLLAGCGGGSDDTAATTTSSVSGVTTTAAATSEDEEPVLMCPLLSKADAEAILGAPLAEGPTEVPPSGSQLGRCEYFTATAMGLVTEARPSEEFQASVEEAASPESIEGVGDEAVFDPNQGLLVRLADEGWFLTVQAFRETNLDKDLAISAAHKVVAAV